MDTASTNTGSWDVTNGDISTEDYEALAVQAKERYERSPAQFKVAARLRALREHAEVGFDAWATRLTNPYTGEVLDQKTVVRWEQGDLGSFYSWSYVPQILAFLRERGWFRTSVAESQDKSLSELVWGTQRVDITEEDWRRQLLSYWIPRRMIQMGSWLPRNGEALPKKVADLLDMLTGPEGESWLAAIALTFECKSRICGADGRQMRKDVVEGFTGSRVDTAKFDQVQKHSRDTLGRTLCAYLARARDNESLPPRATAMALGALTAFPCR